jgi:long-chain acyl-CoA synthetase
MPTFYDRFVECAARWPENVALEVQRADRLESYTFAEARRMAESIGRWLADQGLEAGSRVAILADNDPRWVAAYLGTIAAGLTIVPLDTGFRADQVSKLLKDSGSVLLFCDARHVEVATQAVSQGEVRLVLLNPKDLHASVEPAWTADLDTMFVTGPGSFRPVAVESDSIAAILYTSGTTADPKGVMLTHGNIMGEVNAVLHWANIGPGDAILGVLPMFHVLAQMANLLLPIASGARGVYLETLNTTELLRGLRERKITAFAVVPQFFYLIHERIFKEAEQRGRVVGWILSALMRVNRALRIVGINAGGLFFGKVHAIFGRRMRFLVSGGSRFDPQIARDFHALGIDVLQAYGLTETSGGAFANSPGDNVIGSVGKPLWEVESEIVDQQKDEESGETVGEILIRGPLVMKGYWNRPDATAAALKDGWLYTGDLGYFDKSGNLFITGRKKELIILANGKNIYPEEIETHYLKSPFIQEICVMALEARAGDPTSERLHAVLVPNLDVLKQRKIVNMKEVIRFDIEGLSAKMPTTKRIGSYEIWQEDLPRTTTRKLKRFEIEKRVRANQARGKTGEAGIAPKPLTAEDEAWSAQPEVQRALRIIREAAKNSPERVLPADNLELDLGLDSMQRVELLVSLEKNFGGDVEESRLAEVYTVRDMVDLVLASAAGQGASPRAAFAGWRAILAEDPADPEVLRLARRQPFAEHFWYGVGRMAAIIASDRFQLRVRGLEKLPLHGPYIICSNHQSFLDPVVLGAVLPWPVFRDTFSVGTSEIFGSGFMRRLARWLRVIVVDPDANLIPAMRAGAFGLRRGRVLMLYPEGERSIDGTPRTFKKGASILSIHLQVPIVPVAIEGFYDAWPRGKPFQKFAPLRIDFGDPIYPPLESEASESAYEYLTAELKNRVVAMWEELRAERSGTRTRATAAD